MDELNEILKSTIGVKPDSIQHLTIDDILPKLIEISPIIFSDFEFFNLLLNHLNSGLFSKEVLIKLKQYEISGLRLTIKQLGEVYLFLNSFIQENKFLSFIRFCELFGSNIISSVIKDENSNNFSIIVGKENIVIEVKQTEFVKALSLYPPILKVFADKLNEQNEMSDEEYKHKFVDGYRSICNSWSRNDLSWN